MQYYRISIEDVSRSEFLFRAFNQATNSLQFRKNYDDLICNRCHKINEIEAAKRGIDPAVRFRVVRDIFTSADDQVIVSARFVDILQSTAKDEVEFYKIPCNADLFVAFPIVLVQPIEGNDAFNIIGECGLCGRYTEAIWGPGIAPPIVGCRVAAYRLESRAGMIPQWEIDENVAAALRSVRPKLKGLILRPK